MIFTSKGELPTLSLFFFFNDTATTEIYTLSLHDALPIYDAPSTITRLLDIGVPRYLVASVIIGIIAQRSEEHTSELQSLAYLVCRLLLEKKKKLTTCIIPHTHLAAPLNDP